MVTRFVVTPLGDGRVEIHGFIPHAGTQTFLILRLTSPSLGHAEVVRAALERIYAEASH